MASPRPPRASDDAPVHGRVLIVEARFYDDIADELLAGATAALTHAGASYDVVTVPGTLEVPPAAAIALDAAAHAGHPYDAVVTLGCVIRGETYHFEIVAGESARALMDLAVARKMPLGNGILTVETDEQAWVRARVADGDKGGGAAKAALSLLRLKRKVG
ncbi:6,7-dimethyl-8-ribityllumazine synthase [Starkeya sp. ORNL1]|uniref:6,7-dimethyl-8-ribityllumazine synthase n=1 Tax=Starkeya sp. ORNL1 TaxID=2709380 RepID=UPI001463B169|nr:6,7-dimethyl-8-ribityllumazine synthase [Starkeya sp. ORNL1]QJP12690.1 6,7-dimethyl-8-ribityllumazine synthase [Starkeya sp. ORNL1]